MKRVISTPRFVLLFSYVILLAHASAEMPEGLKNKMISHRQRHRVARRLALTTQHNQSRPVKGLDTGPGDELFSYNWAGAWQPNIPGGSGTFNAVTGQWQIPDVTVPVAGSDQVWEASAWVGLDGNSVCSALLQAGTITYAWLDNGNLQTEVVAFAEWYPGFQIELNSIDVKIGDTVQVNVYAISSLQGTAEVINLSTGTEIGLSLTAPSFDDNICGLTADWIVENSFLPDGSQVPFAQFSPYHLEDCVAGTTEKLTTDLTDATAIVMVDHNPDWIATPSIVSNTEVDVIYGPPYSLP